MLTWCTLGCAAGCPAGVMSRDLKLQNALLEAQSEGAPLVKLCDFGYSKHEEHDSAAKTCVGTPAYIAPGVPAHLGWWVGQAELHVLAGEMRVSEERRGWEKEEG
jgi:hypothetical protein